LISSPDPELQAWLALSFVQGVGPSNYIRLLQDIGPPEVILQSSAATLSRAVKPQLAQQIKQSQDPALLQQTCEWLQQPGNHLLTLADSDYPQQLLQLPDPPPILYLKGRRELLQSKAIAIVGSRNATEQGNQNARLFARHLSDAGFCIVSGMASGIDRAAHEGGLAGRSSSIAVVGTGLDRVYPARNRDLAHQLAQDGLIISEFALGIQPLAGNFPRRNRIISGLSAGCLVIEATLNSGSLVTARLAAEQGREVMAIPGSIHSPQSKGCHQLLKQGAKLVESAQDVLEEIGVPVCNTAKKADTNASIATDSDYGKILEKMGFDPCPVDIICDRAGLTADKVCAILLRLELEGLVSCLPGGRYQRLA
jgi:DNA processing protein